MKVGHKIREYIVFKVTLGNLGDKISGGGDRVSDAGALKWWVRLL